MKRSCQVCLHRVWTRCYNRGMSTFLKRSSGTAFLLGLIFFTSLLVRLYDLTDEPLELHPTRQMRAALIARSFYYGDNPDIPPDRVEFAQDQVARLGVIEPPILEFLTAQLYRLTGGESPWLGRFISIFFWLAGGWATFSITRDLGDQTGGLIALVYYLFLPFGVRFSRTLLPDIMMIAASVLALWTLYRWESTRKTGWAVTAGVLTGFAILVKSVAGIILIFPFAVFILSRVSFKQAVRNWQIWMILLLAALPSAIYYYWGIVLDGRLATQFSGRFFPELWTDLLLYKSWGKRIIIEFGLPAFILGVISIAVARRKQDKKMIFAWWFGYFLYGMTFAYHIITHDYYHLPMIPLTAVGIGVTTSALLDFTKHKDWNRVLQPLLLILAIGYAGFSSYQSIQFFNQEDYRQTREAWLSLGEILEDLPGGRVMALTEDYETSYKFYTFRSASHWPHTGDQTYFELQGSDRQDFNALWRETEGASYFLVSDFRELNRQPKLEQKLSNLSVLAGNDVFILYSLNGEP